MVYLGGSDRLGERPVAAGQSPESAELAWIWQPAEKIVFSCSLQSVSTKRTRMERGFGPDLGGGGPRMFPDDLRQPLELLDERRFGTGMVFVRRAVR